MLILREVVPSDIHFLLNLRNEGTVRAVSFNPDLIDFDTHQKWFVKKMAALDSVILIAEVDNRPMAQVRFDAMNSADLSHSREVEINIAVTQTMTGKGYGTDIIKLASAKLLSDHPSLWAIHALIKPDNEASLKSFKKAGYVFYDFKTEKGHRCVDMVLMR